jgi:site-specific DNA-methyltransferase (adenine-specific)
MPEPYFDDGTVTLYLGDCREILPALGITADCVIADPPYGETSLAWDRWPDGWLEAAAGVSRSLWCFGSMRLFGTRWGEFTAAGWRFSHDGVLEKGAGAGPSADRLRRVHESITFWYRGPWRDLRHVTPRLAHDGPGKGSIANGAVPHLTGGARKLRTWTDDGTRYARSVFRAKANRGGVNIHPNQKPVHVLKVLAEYGCPPGGLIVAPFAGSGSDLVAARATDRRAIGIEGDEAACEKAARWLAEPALFGEAG